MNLNPPPNRSAFPSRSQVTAALQRAAERARVTAEQTGTQLIVVLPHQAPSAADHSAQTLPNVAHKK